MTTKAVAREAGQGAAAASGPGAADATPGRPTFLLAPFAFGGGLLASAAFAPLSWWPAMIAAVFVLARVVDLAGRPRAAVGLGLLYGLGLNLVVLSWSAAITVAIWPAFALVEALYFAALGGLLYAVRRLALAPVAAAGCWVAIETIQGSFPFGGFSWTRVGYPFIDTPLAGLFGLAGTPLVTFAVALVAHLAAWALRAVPARRVRRWVVAGGSAALATGIGALAGLLPGAPASSPTVNVGWVQGGRGDSGYYGLGEARSTVTRHLAETDRLLGEVAAGSLPRPDFLAWPENGTDMDPYLDGPTYAGVMTAVAESGLPVLVGSPVSGPGPGQRQTSMLWFDGDGIAARYDKRNLVPFGEWIPFRAELLPLVPLLSEIGDDAVPGGEPGVLSVADAAGRPLQVGTAICFEVAFPATMRDAFAHGAELMVVGSNNAMFQSTPQLEQQFAITRVRAAEARRQILVVTVSGASGLIDDHGRPIMRATEGGPDSGVATMTRTRALSPYVAGGWVLEYLLDAGAAAAVLAAALAAARRRRAPQWGTGTPGTDGEPTDG